MCWAWTRQQPLWKLAQWLLQLVALKLAISSLELKHSHVSNSPIDTSQIFVNEILQMTSWLPNHKNCIPQAFVSTLLLSADSVSISASVPVYVYTHACTYIWMCTSTYVYVLPYTGLFSQVYFHEFFKNWMPAFEFSRTYVFLPI